MRLGLDLKGGVHLVLRVQTDDALRLETETAMNRLREELVKAGATAVTASAPSPIEFELTGVPPEQDAVLRQTATEVEATYNRDSGVDGILHVPDEAEHRQSAPAGDRGSGDPRPSSGA